MISVNRNQEVPFSGHAESQYRQNHQYAQRVVYPAPPDIPYNGTELPVITAVGPGSHPYQEGEFVSPGFFEHIDPSLFKLPQGEIEWTYSRRREAQRILPFLYLGPWSFLSNRQWLREEGITLLLGVRDHRLAQTRLVSGQRAAAELGIECDSFDISDYRDLIARLPQAIRRINDHVYPSPTAAGPKKVLVFCETGNGLSAMVVLSYVMVMLNLDFGQALNFLHSQRFCIDMEDSVRPLLISFEAILAAKRDVESSRRAVASSNLAVPAPTLSKKRSFADQVAEEAEDNMEAEASSERKPLAPFQDRWG
ncbi:protein-tyrosine phosphatase-like protein [Aspergillus egyptiacus]|nr:protein-tyrosine phosphatase-like protein [Aspergillus egyptiacus]